MSGTIELEGIGAVDHLAIPIPERGGVVVLKGGNGSGKSTALRATERMLTGKGGLEPADGRKKGTATGLGVQLTVGRSVRSKGELTVLGVSGTDPAAFVDPGIKSSEAANAARLKALCRLARVEVTPETFGAAAEAAGIDLGRELDGADLSDPAAVAGRLQRAAFARARDLEGRAASEHAEAQGALQALEGASVAEDGQTVADLASSREERAQRVQELKAQRQASAERAKLVAERRQQIEQLEARLERMKVWLQSDEAQPLEAPTEEQIETAIGEVAKADDALAQAEQAIANRERRASALERLDKAKAMQAEAERRREAAGTFDAALMDALGAALPPALRIADGQLQAITDRGPIDFEQLSQGERWSLALGIAIAASGGATLMAVPQEAWEGLDPDNRAALTKAAQAKGVVILTAEADSGPLRSEVFGASGSSATQRED